MRQNVKRLNFRWQSVRIKIWTQMHLCEYTPETAAKGWASPLSPSNELQGQSHWGQQPRSLFVTTQLPCGWLTKSHQPVTDTHTNTQIKSLREETGRLSLLPTTHISTDLCGVLRGNFCHSCHWSSTTHTHTPGFDCKGRRFTINKLQLSAAHW